MRVLSVFLGVTAFSVFLSGCTQTEFAYHMGGPTFSVLASADNPQISDQHAMAVANKICEQQNAYPYIKKKASVYNNVDRVSVNGEYVYLAKEYQAHDYMTVLYVNCMPNAAKNPR